MQEWSNNNILIFSIHNEGKSIIPERFIKTLNARIYKKMTKNDSYPNYAISKYAKISVFDFFEKVINKGQLKIVYVNHYKWPDLAVLSF